MNNRYISFIIIFSLALISISVYSESDSDSEINNSFEEKNKVNTELNKPRFRKKRKNVKTLEEFIPTDEISADKPVSFPVDI